MLLGFPYIYLKDFYCNNTTITYGIDHEDFLPDKNYLCYAYGPDDPNEFKYARVSLLEAKLAQDVRMQWDFSLQGTLDCNSNIAWARFRTVEDMRRNLECKFKQIVKRFPSAESIAKAYTELIKVITDLSRNVKDAIDTREPSSHHYNWVLFMLNNNKQDILEKEISKLINNESFLTTIPSKI